MLVFADFHHEGLLESLILLFEKRLGGKLYRPIGIEWFTEGYWKLNDIEATAKQFLKVGSQPYKEYPPLNSNPDDLSRVITLEHFKEVKFDILIASIPQHIEPFKELIQKYQPQAKLIYQIGNQWNVEPGLVQNVMASAKVSHPSGVNIVEYHQEFDLSIFHPGIPNTDRKIYSFINCLGNTELFKKDWELFLELERLMPDWRFRSFGGQCRDGYCTGEKDLADKMREATFIFHCKTGGDGYGHIIHNAAAVGRPLIIRAGDYKGKLAEPLIDDLSGDTITAVTVDDKSPRIIADSLEFLCSVGAQSTLSKNIIERFRANVDFDAEQKEIEAFLGRLQ